MKLQVIACAIAGATLATTSVAKQSHQAEQAGIRKEMVQLQKVEAAASPADATGDADAFGRNVRFIGLMSSGVITLANDCTPDPDFPPGPDDHCFVTSPNPVLTTFSVADVARIIVPARASNSLFCHWQTPVVVTSYYNQTGVYQGNARFTLTPSYTLQNAVFNDPALINPSTGLPFGGSLTVSLPGIRHARGLQPGDYQTERHTDTRACIGGLVSKRALMESYGLTATQATNFFRNETVITLSLQGSSSLVEYAGIIYGTRFVGD